MKNPINCRLCGKYVSNPANGQVYCKECRDWIYKNKHKDFYEKSKTQQPKKNKPSLSDIMHEATKEGLQYAAYCKKHGLH